jgi:hypothetical protein
MSQRRAGIRSILFTVLATQGLACACPPSIGTTTREIDVSDEPLEAIESCELCEGTGAEQKYREAGFRGSEIAVSCSVTDSAEDGSPLVLTCSYNDDCAAGRRLRDSPAPAPVAASRGGWWARMAQLEQEAVWAFTELAGELARLGAPSDLVTRANAASRDEVRHAAQCRAMARRHGIESAMLCPPASTTHSATLFELAHLNAVEGCCRETFAALEVAAQSRVASDAATRRVLRAIADDEMRHAQLSWDIDAWARSMLSVAETGRLDIAQRDAAADLRAALHDASPADPVLGRLAPRRRIALLDALTPRLLDAA